MPQSSRDAQFWRVCWAKLCCELSNEEGCLTKVLYQVSGEEQDEKTNCEAGLVEFYTLSYQMTTMQHEVQKDTLNRAPGIKTWFNISTT
jgi:hypothetical protein